MSLHALLLVDREHLRHQYAQLGRLCVALTTSGCTVQAVTPAPPFGDDHPADRPVGFGTPIQFPDQVAPWLRQARVDRLREQIERQPIDLIWSLGRGTWSLALALSQQIERPVVIEIDGHAEANALRRQRRMRHQIAGVITPSEPLRELVARSFVRSEVESILPGIAIGALDRKLRRDPQEDGPLGLSILGTGRSRSNDRALLEALARLRERGRDFHCVLELVGSASAYTWSLVQKLQLTDLCTVITEPSRVARLLAAGDVLIRATIENRIRPIVLEAMAEGTPVVTMPERWLDHLEETDGATIVSKPTPTLWMAALDTLLGDEDHRGMQGERARNSVAKHNRSSDRASAVLHLFEHIVGKDPLPLHD
ncbi:MAG: glycosyltransferase family 4 protein [Planctomycetota bacterium]|nr:glycosyltransferase family 4 protein [Planctomycetota bacterium]